MMVRVVGLGLCVAACGGDSGGGSTDGGFEADAAPPCVSPTTEERGNGKDDDCDGLIDEARVCADGDFTTIGAAVAAAADGTGIEVCAGTYAERFEVAGKAVAIRGAGAETTIIDGGGAGSVVAIRAGAAAKLEGLTIRNGRTTGGGGGVLCDGGAVGVIATNVTGSRADTGGGGLYARACSVQIERARFTGNEGTTTGGAVMLIDSTGEIAESHFAANSADDGGALYLYEGAVTVKASELRDNTGRVHGGAVFVGADATIADSTLAGNRSNWTGGAIYVDRHAPQILRNTIEANTAVEEGGGLYLHESQALIADNRIAGNRSQDDGGGVRLFTCSARLERNVIAGNHAGTDGGGVKSSHMQSVFLDNEIVDNVAEWSGGGIEMDNDSSLVRGGVIARNEAARGGGIHAMLFPWADGTIEDVRIVDNKAGKGGGIHMEDNFQPILIRRVVISGNSTWEDGGGVYARTTNFTLTNATVTDNIARGDGGGVWMGKQDKPWLDPCPCPPTDGAMTVAFSVFRGNTVPNGVGAAVWTSLSSTTIESSILDGHAGVGVAVMEGAVPTWRFNDTVPASFVGMFDPTGTNGNMSVAPSFRDVATGDFRLGTASACIDAGNPQMRDRDGTRADMGAFAGPDSP